jgi:hypothetical protein
MSLCAAPQLPVSGITAQKQVTPIRESRPCWRGKKVEIKMPPSGRNGMSLVMAATQLEHVFPLHLRFY